MSKLDTITNEQRKLIIEMSQAIYRSKFKDPLNPPSTREIARSYGKSRDEFYRPDAYDFRNPETFVIEYWQQYLTTASLHGAPKNKKGTTQYDTSKLRRKFLKQIEQYSGIRPDTQYLKVKFQLPSEYDEICNLIDEDIASLL